MIRGSIWTLPFGKIRFSQLNTASAGIVPHCRFFSAWTEEMPEVIALDHVLVALDVPDIDSYIGLMHTLFTLEDRYGLEVCECDDEVHLRVHIHKGRDAAQLHRMLTAWGAVAAKLKAGEITREEYDRWRYYYPKYDTSGQWHKITPSQELSDMLMEALNKNGEEDNL